MMLDKTMAMEAPPFAQGEVLAFPGNQRNVQLRLQSPARSLLVVPLLVYLITSLVFALLWDAMPLPALISILSLLIALPVSMPRSYIKAGAVAKGSLLPLGLCMLAVIGGMLTGVYTYEMYTSPLYAIALGRNYDNVLASTPGAAYGDAGKIRFASTSKVMVDLSVGYRVSPTYCVAPIMDTGPAQLRTVAFWAIGTECCNARGSFMCGTRVQTARGGVRVPPDGIFTSTSREFRRAIEQAAFIANLAIDPDPIILHWVESPGEQQVAMVLGIVKCLSLGLATFAIVASGCLGMYSLQNGSPEQERQSESILI